MQVSAPRRDPTPGQHVGCPLRGQLPRRMLESGADAGALFVQRCSTALTWAIVLRWHKRPSVNAQWHTINVRWHATPTWHNEAAR